MWTCAGCQMLRILSFSSTVLPGPAYHCLASQATSTLAWPEHWWQNLVLDIRRQSTRSCGDLIFSSHTTFILSFVLAFNYYGRVRLSKPSMHFSLTENRGAIHLNSNSIRYHSFVLRRMGCTFSYKAGMHTTLIFGVASSASGRTHCYSEPPSA